MSGACGGQERTPTEPTPDYMQPSGDQAPTADAGVEGGNMKGGLDENEKNAPAPATMGMGTAMGTTGVGGTTSSVPGALGGRTSGGTTGNTGIGGGTNTSGSPRAVGNTGAGGTHM